jgi:hypothetical protein
VGRELDKERKGLRDCVFRDDEINSIEPVKIDSVYITNRYGQNKNSDIVWSTLDEETFISLKIQNQ